MQPHIISKAFANVGAYPINKAAVDISQLTTSAINAADPDLGSADGDLPTSMLSQDNNTADIAGALKICKD